MNARNQGKSSSEYFTFDFGREKTQKRKKLYIPTNAIFRFSVPLHRVFSASLFRGGSSDCSTDGNGSAEGQVSNAQGQLVIHIDLRMLRLDMSPECIISQANKWYFLHSGGSQEKKGLSEITLSICCMAKNPSILHPSSYFHARTISGVDEIRFSLPSPNYCRLSSFPSFVRRFPQK